VRDADLRLLHAEAPLEGAALHGVGPRRPLAAKSLCCQAAQGRQQRQPSLNSTACLALSCRKRTCILHASAERLQTQVHALDAATVRLLTPWSGRVQGGFALHWPLINSDHMRTRLAQRELEAKRLEDARRWRPGPVLQR